MVVSVLRADHAARPEGLDPLVVAVDGLAAVVDRREDAVGVAQHDDRCVEVTGLTDGRIDADRPGGVHHLDLAAGDEAGHVEVVDGHVAEDPARHLDVGDGRRRRVRLVMRTRWSWPMSPSATRWRTSRWLGRIGG